MKAGLKLYETLKADIEKGHYQAGERLPSTGQFAETYKISGPTAHKALSRLTDEGFLYRQLGKGTFISKDYEPKEKTRVLLITSEENEFQKSRTLDLMTRLQDIETNVFIHVCGDKEGDMSIDFFDGREPDVIVLKSYLYRLSHQLAETYKNKIPVIFLGETHAYHFPGTIIHPNIYQATCLAVNHLISKGHTKIAALSVMHENVKLHFEKFAYLDSMEKAGLTYRQFIHIKPSTSSLPAAQAFFDSPDNPTAIFCMLDHRALGLIDYADSKGLKRGKDYSIMTGWNTSESEIFSLSSIDLKWNMVTQKCIDEIKDIQSGKTLGINTQHLIQPSLIQRDSVVNLNE
ncbi:GntR family transcriptional regulator [bacterium AH-315-E10]|nr:GntR family transcriptional regulator [bacterium AH-315-E10]